MGFPLFVPKSDSRIAPLALEMLHPQLLTCFEVGLEATPHLLGCHTRSEVEFAVFRDVREHFGFQVRKEN